MISISSFLKKTLTIYIIPNRNRLVKKIDYNTKIRQIENKVPSITGLVTTAALNTKAT